MHSLERKLGQVVLGREACDLHRLVEAIERQDRQVRSRRGAAGCRRLAGRTGRAWLPGRGTGPRGCRLARFGRLAFLRRGCFRIRLLGLLRHAAGPLIRGQPHQTALRDFETCLAGTRRGECRSKGDLGGTGFASAGVSGDLGGTGFASAGVSGDLGGTGFASAGVSGDLGGTGFASAGVSGDLGGTGFASAGVSGDLGGTGFASAGVSGDLGGTGFASAGVSGDLGGTGFASAGALMLRCFFAPVGAMVNSQGLPAPGPLGQDAQPHNPCWPQRGYRQ